MIQLPLRVAKRHQRMGRTQFAALPWRIVDGDLEICLITSRGRGRWILPKGWPMDGATPAEAAALEAREEAGLIATPQDRCLGIWSYTKGGPSGGTPHFAMVFPVQVTQVLEDWPERRQRRRKWFDRERAAAKLAAPELRQMVLGFDPAPMLQAATFAPPHAGS